VGLNAANTFVKLNFGAKSFKFDYCSFLKKYVMLEVQEILEIDIKQQEIYSIVNSHLFSNGYLDTLQFFNKQLSLNSLEESLQIFSEQFQQKSRTLFSSSDGYLVPQEPARSLLDL